MPPVIQPDQLSEVRQLTKELFEKATAYSKTVLTVGYAGFFGAWTLTKAYLQPWEPYSPPSW